MINTRPQQLDSQQFGRIWPQCVARAWQDTEFRAALKRDPAGMLLKEFQFAIPAGVKIEVAESGDEALNTASDTLRMIIPPAPDMRMSELAPKTIERCIAIGTAYSFTC